MPTEFLKEFCERHHIHRLSLFGSVLTQRFRVDSDVDILVIMPARNQLDQAFKIHSTLLPNFPLDIIVLTPEKWREESSFHREIAAKGKVLYEKRDAGVGAEGRRRLPARRKARPKSRVVS